MVPCTYQRLLTNNDPATPLELAQIAGELQKMKTTHHELQFRIQQHETVLTQSSSLRKMPLELWGRIFDIATFSSDAESGTYGYTDSDAVVAFCLVCRAWRDAAYLEGGPWGLRIDIDALEPRALSTLQLWVGRASKSTSSLRLSQASGQFPLDVGQLCDCGGIGESDDADTDDALCVMTNSGLLAFLSSDTPLNALTLPCGAYLCFRKLMESVRRRTTPGRDNTWNQLRTLGLEFGMHEGDYAWEDALDPSQSIFHYLPPNLTSLELRYEDSRESPPSAIPPPSVLSKLKSLTLQTPFVFQPHAFLKWCHELECLTLNFSGARLRTGGSENNTYPPTLSILTLPALRRLCIEGLTEGLLSGNDPTISDGLVSYLRLPLLCDLTLGVPASIHSVESVLRLLSSMEVPGTQLSSLTIQDPYFYFFPIPVYILVATLARLPSLTRLCLDAVNLEGDLFAEIQRYSSRFRQDVLPSLEVLEVENLRLDDSFEPESVLRYLEGRSVTGQGGGQDDRMSSVPSHQLKKIVFGQWASEELREGWEESFGVVETLRASYGVFVERFER